MLGALISLLFAFGAAAAVWKLFPRLRESLDPAESVGLSGLVGLGLSGLLVLLIGLFPGALTISVYVVGGVAILSALIFAAPFSKTLRAKRPESWKLAALAALCLAVLIALVGALGPSDMSDWDSLAYHLAVPKLWLQHGQIDYIPFIHHSNFPGAIDNLFILGLTPGGAAGAKAFSVAVFVLGILVVFGLARRRYGENCGWIAALAFVGVPAILWESGTAYIDVAHGLVAGLGIVYAAELIEGKPAALRMALCLALACASKYTGLQTVFACAVVLLVGCAMNRKLSEAAKAVGLTALASLIIAGPWYLRNVVNTGNPVYPFFYGVFHGKNWDDFSAKIYAEEQKTFGAGSSPSDIGAATLGLAYQPGRYTNPSPTGGNGFPTGALGFVVVGTWLAWLFSGKMGRFEKSVLAATGISLLMWFVLSQQSRYLITLAVPACVLAGGALERLKVGPIVAVLTGVQALYSLYVGKFFHLDPKLPVVVGKVSEEDYLKANVPFYEAALAINQIVPKDGKVALYDEVFGYFLDLPYFWANPGHSTLIPYDRIQNGLQLSEELKKLGFTHVYMNMGIGIAFPSPEAREKWMRQAGLILPFLPVEPGEREAAFQDLRNKWRALVGEAIAEGYFEPILSPSFTRGRLYHIK